MITALIALIGAVVGFVRSHEHKLGVRLLSSLLGALVALMLAGVVLVLVG
jgi:hypothetical protein